MVVLVGVELVVGVRALAAKMSFVASSHTDNFLFKTTS